MDNLDVRNDVFLDYKDNHICLELGLHSAESLANKTFFCMKLEPFVAHLNANEVIFDAELNYRDCVRISDVLHDNLESCLGWKYSVTQNFENYIQSRDIRIKERAKLGIELKTDATRLSSRYIDFKNTVDKIFIRTLREQQMRNAFFMYMMMRSGNFSVPGSGKTSSALAVYAYLHFHKKVDRVVVICPKNAFGSWIDEWMACFGDNDELRVFNVQKSALNKKNKKIWLKYDSASCNLFLFNYESVGGYVSELKSIVSDKALLIYDEVHRVKAIGGKYAKNSLDVAKKSKFIIAMTGTPIPNTYADLYNLLHILYNDEYDDFFGFDTSLLKKPSFWEINEINKQIQPFFCRTSKDDLMVPKANPDKIILLNVSNEEQQLFEILTKKYRKCKLALFVRLLQMESNPKKLLEAIDLSEFEDILEMDEYNEFVDYVDYSEDVEYLIKHIDESTKKEACLDLVSLLVREGKTVIVWCIFKDSIKDICRRLLKKGIKAKYIMGEVPLDERQSLLASFKNGMYDVLVTNPHTLAESISLHTICHDAVYYEYSYNLVHLLQSKDRIHRLGLSKNQYTQYYYLQDEYVYEGEGYSLDGSVYNRLLEKESAMLNAIDNQQLDPVYTTEEDLAKIFATLE